MAVLVRWEGAGQPCARLSDEVDQVRIVAADGADAVVRQCASMPPGHARETGGSSATGTRPQAHGWLIRLQGVGLGSLGQAQWTGPLIPECACSTRGQFSHEAFLLRFGHEAQPTVREAGCNEKTAVGTWPGAVDEEFRRRAVVRREADPHDDCNYNTNLKRPLQCHYNGLQEHSKHPVADMFM